MHLIATPPTFSGPSNATRTVVRLTPGANVDVQIVELGVSFDGTTSGATPIRVWLAKSASASGGTTSSITLQAVRDSGATVQATATSYTSEPTYTSQVLLKQWYVPPTSGLTIQFPLGREPQRLAGASVGWELMVSSVTASGTPNIAAYLEFVQGSS